MSLGAVALGREHIGVRKLRALVRGLPRDSAIAEVLGLQWSDAEELAATQVELMHTVLRVLLRGFGAKTKTPPLRVERPKPLVPSLPAETIAPRAAVRRTMLMGN